MSYMYIYVSSVLYMPYICHIYFIYMLYMYIYVSSFGGGGVQLKLNYSDQAMVVVKYFSNVAVC